MSEEPETPEDEPRAGLPARRPAAPRPVRQRPAPAQVTSGPGRRRAAARETAGSEVVPTDAAPARRRKRPRAGGDDAGGRRTRGAKPASLPRIWWLGAAVEVTFIVIVLVDWLSGWGDPPHGCSRSLCTTGQGVGLVSLVALVLLGGVLLITFLTVAVGAAYRQPSQGRTPKTR